MNNAHSYRLRQINEIEREFHEEKIKHTILIEKYHSVINFCDACLFIVRFCVFSLNVVFVKFPKNYRDNFCDDFTGLCFVVRGFDYFYKNYLKTVFEKSSETREPKTVGRDESKLN